MSNHPRDYPIDDPHPGMPAEPYNSVQPIGSLKKSGAQEF